jgi:hypothetical protein
MELEEIQLSPERAKVGLDIRVVGYVCVFITFDTVLFK